jgi:predicted dithiol-disulfide oxidoreductase (DUF899 family)
MKPNIATGEEWLSARLELLEAEKDLVRHGGITLLEGERGTVRHLVGYGVLCARPASDR